MASTAARLQAVQNQIDAIVSAGVESYSISNRSATKLKLDQLYTLEEKLEAKLAKESGGTFRPAKLRGAGR